MELEMGNLDGGFDMGWIGDMDGEWHICMGTGVVDMDGVWDMAYFFEMGG